jgi:hypothetical protein
VKGLRVLLVSVVGPSGQADVAARADVSLGDLAAAVTGAVGPIPQDAVVRVEPGDGRRATRRTRLEQTLADAGAVDGDVVVFAQENPVVGANH